MVETTLALPVSSFALPRATRREILFRRLEIKYMVDRPTRTALTRDLAAFMRSDAHGGPDGAYLVRSLYLDTPDYMAYHEKLAGAAVRHKLRVRAYGEDLNEESHLRLEVKSRYLNFIHKITVEIPWEDYGEVESALRRHSRPPEGLLRDSRVSQEFFRLQRQYNLEPKVVVQYRRQAFERLDLSRIRVNFDDELLATRRLDLTGPLCGARRILRPGHAIFEIKVDDGLPYWMHTLIGKYNLRHQAISKYCFAVRSEGRFTAIVREDGT